MCIKSDTVTAKFDPDIHTPSYIDRDTFNKDIDVLPKYNECIPISCHSTIAEIVDGGYQIKSQASVDYRTGKFTHVTY